VSERWIAVGSGKAECVLIGTQDLAMHRFDSKLWRGTAWDCAQTPDGSTLLLLDPNSLDLARYALP
jgi:hypothetical protein